MLSYLTPWIFPNRMLKSFYSNIGIAFITLMFFIFPFITPLAADNKKDTVSSEENKKYEQQKSPEQTKSPPKQEKKLHVTSDSMLVEKESSIITFSGNVVATQADAIIKADSISVLLFTDKEKKATPANIRQEIKSLTASGNVQLSSGNRTASADQALYTSTDQKIILTGESPRVTTGESYITGKKIILFQNSGKVIVEGEKDKRVEALFDSKDDFKQDN